ncbi:hypothetical protein Q7P37_004476 [Cladosporium fusiforme]
MAALDALPEELQLLILEYLDTPSPSSQKLRQEPSLALTSSDDRTLKNLSVASKGWRRLVLPPLFKCARLRLDTPPKPEWAACSVCNEAAILPDGVAHETTSMTKRVDQYHADMVAAALARCNGNLRAGRLDDEAQQMGEMAFSEKERIRPSAALAWIPRFYHSLCDFIEFFQGNDLTGAVDSFVLYTDQMLTEKLHRFPHEAADKDWRFPASAAFWAHLLAVISPSEITILAPPTDLACLTNCAIDTFGDWAFGEMDFHVVSLRQAKVTSLSETSSSPPSYTSLRPIPATYPSIAPSSILSLRPWSHLSLNEGSFLKAYGTYEFFERGPPSLVYSIKASVMRNTSFPQLSQWDLSANPSLHIPATQTLSALTSLDYTAIFPFANHADFSHILPRISQITLQLAPDAESNILNDRSRLGKADLSDCWTELLTTYQQLIEHLASVRRPGPTAFEEGTLGDFVWDTSSHGLALRKLVAMDFRIKAMQEDMDTLFMPLCLPVWVEAQTGVFTRMVQEWEG